jgi:hypothetical protein
VLNLGIGVAALTYNGQGGNDLLTINAPAGSTTVYNPGSTPDAGSVQTNSLVPLSFTNLGNGGQAVNLAGGAASSLIYNGTAAKSIFTVTGLTGPTGGLVQLQINGVNQLPIVTNVNVTSLTLNGVAGNDTFNLAGGLPYSTTTVDGGTVANLTNPIGNIAVNLADSVLNTYTTITGYGGAVTVIGVVTANLSTAGNALLVNGTSLNDNTTYTPTGTSAGTFTQSAPPCLECSSSLSQTVPSSRPCCRTGHLPPFFRRSCHATCLVGGHYERSRGLRDEPGTPRRARQRRGLRQTALPEGHH